MKLINCKEKTKTRIVHDFAVWNFDGYTVFTSPLQNVHLVTCWKFANEMEIKLCHIEQRFTTNKQVDKPIKLETENCI